MGLGDLFKKTVVCPECRTRGAMKTAFGQVRCRNRGCARFHESALAEPAALSAEPVPQPAHHGTFDPGEHRIMIHYRTFRGDDTAYVGDGRTIRFKKAHVTVQVAPTGERIALWQKFVKNLEELKRLAPSAEPAPRERQILRYHTRHGTTSPRYEALRRKYPDWTP